jgi:hypothetical protein
VYVCSGQFKGNSSLVLEGLGRDDTNPKRLIAGSDDDGDIISGDRASLESNLDIIIIFSTRTPQNADYSSLNKNPAHGESLSI